MIIPFLKGLATTLTMVFTKPITQQYPEEKREMFPRWRGHPQLTIDPDGHAGVRSLHLVHGGLPLWRHPGHRRRMKAEDHEKVSGAVHHRPAALHLLRSLPGGLPQGRHQVE